MEDKNKHNIFSKEEFFKHIEEKRSLPSDADEFDKEAMEGLSLVKDRTKLDKLDAAIDEIVHLESKGGRKKNIYYFAAAASLALIIGLFFLVKETAFKKGDLAQTAPEKTENVVGGFDFPPPPGAQNNSSGGEDKKVVTEEPAKLKEETFKEGKLEEKAAKGESFANSVTTVNVPAESANRGDANEKVSEEGWANGAGAGVAAAGKMQDNKAGGKSTLDETSVADQEQSWHGKDAPMQKPEEKKTAQKKSDEFSKNLEESKLYKEKDEKEKPRYESNTVWTSTPSPNGPGSLKQQSQTDTKPKVAADDRSVAGSTAAPNTAPVTTQTENEDLSKSDKNNNSVSSTGEDQLKSSEVKVSRSKSGGSKHRKLRSKSAAYEPAPSRENDKDVAGYSYYSQTSTRDFTSPEFIGGTTGLQQFISNNLQVSEPNKNGTVSVEFTVKPDGAVDTTSVKVTQPIRGCEPCTKDVTELVKKMPKWQPALENGKGKEYRQKMSVPYHSKQVKK